MTYFKSLVQSIFESNNNIVDLQLLHLLEYDETMGRKKKESKEIETMSNESEVNEVRATLNHLALGIARLQDGTWGVAEIAYNAETGESDLQDVRVAGKSREDAIELFKITAVEKGIV